MALSFSTGFTANGFNGDIVSLQYILKTLERKSYLIPGVTTNQDVSVTAMGESAYYFKRDASSVELKPEGLGSQIDFTGGKHVTGVKRVPINLTNAIQIHSVLPHVNFATVSADVVGDRVVQETIEAANKWNVAGEEAMVANGTSKTYTAVTVDTVYGVLLGAKKEFIKDNKAKALKPTAIICSPEVVAALKEKNLILFKDSMPNQSEKILGYFDNMAVVESFDLDNGFIMLNSLGFGAPLNVNTLVVADGTAAGYPAGTIIAGEMGYAFEVCDKDLIHVYQAA